MTQSKKLYVALLALFFAVTMCCSTLFAVPAHAATEESDKTDITEKIVVWDDAKPDSHDYTEIRLLLNSGNLDISATTYINDNPTTFAVDLCEYIYIGVNGVEYKVRDLLADNQDETTQYKGSEFPMSLGGVFSPVAVQAAGTDVVVRILKDFAPYGEFTFRIKAGFEISAEGVACVTTEDIVYGYVSSGWIRHYDITWNINGTETTVLVPDGTVPSYDGNTDKESTIDKVYTFAGWDKEPVAAKGHAKYTAQYTESTRQYDVTFGDAAPVKADYGSKLTKPADPVKEPTATEVFTFEKWVWVGTETEWDFENDTVTGDVKLDPVFTAQERKYTVTFDGENAQQLPYGSKLQEPSIPAKPSDAQNDYTFDGWYNGDTKWDFAVDEVTSDLALTSKYKVTLRSYNVVIRFEGVEKNSVTLTLNYGEMVDFTPYEEEGYTFKVMDDDKEVTSYTVSGEATLVLVYAQAQAQGSGGCSGVVIGSSAVAGLCALGVAAVCLFKKRV